MSLLSSGALLKNSPRDVSLWKRNVRRVRTRHRGTGAAKFRLLDSKGCEHWLELPEGIAGIASVIGKRDEDLHGVEVGEPVWTAPVACSTGQAPCGGDQAPQEHVDIAEFRHDVLPTVR